MASRKNCSCPPEIGGIMKKNDKFEPVEHDGVMGDKYEHPTFGTLHFSRGQGTARPLFGSSIEHSTRISLTISNAHLWRNLNRDWIHSDKKIVEVEMSPTQFADAITSLNSGDIPVTIRYIRGDDSIDYWQDAPFQNKVQQFNAEFEKDIVELSKEFDEVIKLAEDTKAQKRLIKALELLKQGFKNNLPFVNESFSDQMEHTVKEAKGAVEGYITGLVQQYGIEAIRNQAPRISEAEDTKLLE